jgi:amino acid adenylation domain-containing protein
MRRSLNHLLEDSTQRLRRHTAVEDPERDRRITYGELNSLSDSFRDTLARCGIRRGDRVGICAPKSIGVVASIFGILKAGACYVPVDATAPSSRNASIFDDCSVGAIVVNRESAAPLASALGAAGPRPLAGLDELANYECDLILMEGPKRHPVREPLTGISAQKDLAYILYTSGSTGKPKGVIHTHDSALSFVDWCSTAFVPTEKDRFSSHAPFHFDLSILDLYVPLKHGGTLILFGEEFGKTPAELAAGIAGQGITVWYSTPSILRLLVQYGRLERYDWSHLRLVLFAGEVYPMKHLRALKAAWPMPRYFNLYGPTETNVCTYYEVPREIPADRETSLPIGATCENDRAKVVNKRGRKVRPGQEGELLVAGGSVMVGYWNLPAKTKRAFSVDVDGIRWYKTGDIVRQSPDGNHDFLGRRDRMVKRRGYRVELGEIEAALYRHPAIVEAAATALPDEDRGIRIKAFLSCSGSVAPSMIELKVHCARNLPLYMIPDEFSIHDSLPKTSTNKIDYQTLRTLT